MFESLKKEMDDQNMKAYTLAKRADIVPSDLYQVLKGMKPMYPGWKKRIAAVLGKPEEALFPESEAVEYDG